jgi:hypothetical protein
VSLVISGLVASITIGGKALGKTAAIHNSNFMVYKVAIIIKFFTIRMSLFKKDNSKNKGNSKKKGNDEWKVR